jgi:hypothetical protein
MRRSRSDQQTSPRTRRWRAPAGVIPLALVAVLVAGCGGGTEELLDAGGQGPSGPLPTAPDNFGNSRTNGNPALSGSVDVNELIRRLDALNEENDLCTLLTGQAMADVTGADINLTSLVSNPAGFAQLFAALDKLFGHMVAIAPAELSTPLGSMQGVWKQMSTIDPRAADAEARAGALIASPDVQVANDALGAWVVQNCS